jgi:hypothetical protein
MKVSPRTKNRFFIEPKANWLVVTAPKTDAIDYLVKRILLQKFCEQHF